MSARSMESLIYDAPDGRSAGIRRDYGADQVVALRGTLSVRYTLAEHAAKRLWHLLTTEDYVHALGAMTGGQAVQMVRAGLKAIYLSGWQVAADANGAGADLPRSEPLPGRQWAGAGASHQPRAATRRPDRQRRRLRHHGMVRADRGGTRRPASAGRSTPSRSPRPTSTPASAAFTSRTSSHPRRSAATWAARC